MSEGGNRRREHENQAAKTGFGFAASRSFCSCWWSRLTASSASITWICRMAASASCSSNTGELSPPRQTDSWGRTSDFRCFCHKQLHIWWNSVTAELWPPCVSCLSLFDDHGSTAKSRESADSEQTVCPPSYAATAALPASRPVTATLTGQSIALVTPTSNLLISLLFDALNVNHVQYFFLKSSASSVNVPLYESDPFKMRSTKVLSFISGAFREPRESKRF